MNPPYIVQRRASDPACKRCIFAACAQTGSRISRAWIEHWQISGRYDGPVVQVPQVPIDKLIGMRSVYKAKQLGDHDGRCDRSDKGRADGPSRELR